MGVGGRDLDHWVPITFQVYLYLSWAIWAQQAWANLRCPTPLARPSGPSRVWAKIRYPTPLARSASVFSQNLRVDL
jgi:hypothetical protein